jgi:tetratricopeptide (TPR) repeat protein
MLEKRILTLLLVLCASSFFTPVMAQVFLPPGGTDTGMGGANAIQGLIILSNGQRLERRVTVRLQTMTKGDRIAMSDEYGKFVFRSLPTGEYMIVIEKEKDIEPYRQPVDIRQMPGAPAQVYYLSIRLQLKASSEGKPAVLNAELANVPKRALAYYNNAGEQARKNDHDGAIEQLKLAVKEYPSFMLAYNELGVQYLKVNQLENADLAFQEALKIDPNAFNALLNRGFTIVLMKRYGEAVPILRKAVAKNDQSAVAHYFLGQSLANLGLFEDAEKELQASLKLGSDEKDINEAHRMLAIIYVSRGAKKEAAGELEAYLKMAPDAPDAEKLKEKIRQLREPNQ